MRNGGTNEVRLILFGLVSLASLSSARGQGLDVLSYRIDGTIEPDRIVETVQMTATSRRPVKLLELQLASSMELLTCRLGEAEVPFERSDWDLRLDLSAVGSPKGDFTLQFQLQGRPYNNQRERFVRTVISDEHAYIRSQYAWYPRRADDPAIYETHLTARDGWYVRTAGELVETRASAGPQTWIYRQAEPCRSVGLVAGDYTVLRLEPDGGVELDALVFGERHEQAFTLLRAAERAIEFGAGLLGPMTEQRFTLVEMPAAFGTGSGYGETGYALIGSGAFEEAAEAPWAVPLVAHEVMHTWWGREVLFSDFANEMLATYTTLRYMEHAHGEAATRDERERFLQRVTSVAEEHGLVDLDSIEGWGHDTHPAVYSACAYDRAAMLLHILERDVGREAFDSSLRELFEAHKGQIIDYAVVKKALGGSRHKWLFDQWEQPGLPRLSEEHESEKSRASYTLEGTLRQEGTEKPFKMDVTLRAIAGDRTHDHLVAMKKREVKFKFTCPFEPEQILIDPDCHLLRVVGGLEDIEALTDAIFEVANSPGAGDPEVLEDTIGKIHKVIASGPESETVLHTALGRCLFRLGRLEEAVEAFEQALKGGAGGPFHRAWVHLRLGCIADLMQDRKQAESYYERTLAADEKYRSQRTLAQRFLERAYRGYAIDG